MVPDQTKTSLGLEYFCTEGDSLWNMTDHDLIELGKREVDLTGLASYDDVEDGCVVRVPKSYPIYDSHYRDHLAILRKFVDNLENFQTIGRNGLHRYNNQDHAMLTGMLAVRNLTLGEQNDLWSVNTDQEYHEEVHVEAEPRDVRKVLEEAVIRAFPKLDRVAFGLSLGVAIGMLLFVATLTLLLKGGETVGPNLQLLSLYLPSYEVTAIGCVLGLAYGFVGGFIGGWGFAFLRNTSLFLYLATINRGAERQRLHKLFNFF